MISFFQAIAIVLDLGIYALTWLLPPSAFLGVLIWVVLAAVLILVVTEPFSRDRKRRHAALRAASEARRHVNAAENAQLTPGEEAAFRDIAGQFAETSSEEESA